VKLKFTAAEEEILPAMARRSRFLRYEGLGWATGAGLAKFLLSSPLLTPTQPRQNNDPLSFSLGRFIRGKNPWKLGFRGSADTFISNDFIRLEASREREALAIAMTHYY
jgi:hypothetical protein